MCCTRYNGQTWKTDQTRKIFSLVRFTQNAFLSESSISPVLSFLPPLQTPRIDRPFFFVEVSEADEWYVLVDSSSLMYDSLDLS
mmetsp:Transcript_40464/g.56956  ORF Transcript_40464/g.56956 Transcript_40464/m.56956 type:complete len:84 (+) Transcript_40464:250-501(+)